MSPRRRIQTVRACVRGCVGTCVRACVRVRVCVCVCVVYCGLLWCNLYNVLGFYSVYLLNYCDLTFCMDGLVKCSVTVNDRTVLFGSIPILVMIKISYVDLI